MTEKTTSAPLKELEEQLTCAICLDLYTNPRTLPCLHSFCQQCIQHMSTQPLKKEFSCPICLSPTVLPEPGPGGFPVAFHFENLKEVYNLMNKIRDQQVICDNCTTADATGHCKECNQFFCQECIDMHKKWARFATHKLLSLADNVTLVSPVSFAKQVKIINCSVHGNPLELFCKTCEDVVCQSCIAADHKAHDYSGADYYRRRCQKLEFYLNSVREKMTAVSNALVALTNRENEVREQGEAIKEEIHLMMEELVDVLKQSERQLTREVETIIDSKLRGLLDQKKSAEMSLGDLKNCKEFVEQSLQTGNLLQVLVGEKQMMERMIHLTQEVNMEDFKPTENADVQLTKDDDIVDTLHHIGIVFTPTTLQQYKIEKIDPRQLTIRKEMVSFPITIKFHDASFLDVPLSSLNCSVIPVNTPVNTPDNLLVDDSITATITTTAHPGVYMIQCSPLNRGSYEVTIRVKDIQLESTVLVIPFNPCLSTIAPIRTIALKKPWGVAVNSDNHLVVSEYSSNSVTVLDKEGTPVKSFGSGDVKFYCPRGVAITPDNFILVVDDHKIQKINMDGSGIASLGTHGTGALEFSNPQGVTVSPTSGRIYVADRDNHRIKVLNTDLVFSHSFGSKGTAIGQFMHPYCVAIDGQGFLYVADTGNNRIQKFTSDEKFVAEFGIAGSDPGQLKQPKAIVIDVHNWMYISDCTNQRISIFTTDGHFIRSFGEKGTSEGQFYNPRSLAFDSEGTFYVCDYYNRRLVVY